MAVMRPWRSGQLPPRVVNQRQPPAVAQYIVGERDAAGDIEVDRVHSKGVRPPPLWLVALLCRYSLPSTKKVRKELTNKSSEDNRSRKRERERERSHHAQATSDSPCGAQQQGEAHSERTLNEAFPQQRVRVELPDVAKRAAVAGPSAVYEDRPRDTGHGVEGSRLWQPADIAVGNGIPHLQRFSTHM